MPGLIDLKDGQVLGDHAEPRSACVAITGTEVAPVNLCVLLPRLPHGSVARRKHAKVIPIRRVGELCRAFFAHIIFVSFLMIAVYIVVDNLLTCLDREQKITGLLQIQSQLLGE